MPEINIGALRTVAKHLDPLGLKYAFTGGAIVNLLLDDPQFSSVRPTDDLDVIVEMVSDTHFAKIEDTLREAGFQNDVDGPICRWRFGGLIVDIMPTQGERYGLNTQWFPEVLATSQPIHYGNTHLYVVSPIGLLVTKYLAFSERGKGDYYASHDLEDFITVIDGRAEIVAEVQEAPDFFRNYLVQGIRAWLEDPDFRESLSGHLPSDSATQARLPLLRDKLNRIAALKE